ncbi:hypothetical protein BGX27_010533 [Mortierella sp. AM989]|nr:hypothetical protein BGX27_010533 [Mortierella sp. AM989]
MTFPSLLSDHEQRAFSEFLNQLAQEDTSNLPKTDGLSGPGGVDPSLTQQQQQQLHLQLQHHMHLRQLQQQHQQQQQQQQQQSQNGVAGLPRLVPPPPMMSSGISMDTTTQQLAFAQQQRDWIQQISTNPLLAPGGIINPHAMSQAMLQNPLLMAQANAISQAMSAKPAKKRKSKPEVTPISNGHDNGAESNSSRSSSPLPPHSAVNGRQSPVDTAVTNGNSVQIPKIESDTENGSIILPMKKAARRKGSSARSFSIDSTSSNPSGLVVKSPHRTSRDGFDPLQSNTRRKAKGDSNSKSGMSPSTQNSNSIKNDPNINGQEKNEEISSKLERASPSPSAQQRQESTRSPTPSRNSPSTSQSRPNKKAHHELLTEAEKKANHIASEQKRRQNIRVGFDSLVEIVPTLSDCHRSEAVILQKSVDYIHRLLNQKNELKSRVRELQVHLGDPLDDNDSASDMEVEQDE